MFMAVFSSCLTEFRLFQMWMLSCRTLWKPCWSKPVCVCECVSISCREFRSLAFVLKQDYEDSAVLCSYVSGFYSYICAQVKKY